MKLNSPKASLTIILFLYGLFIGFQLEKYGYDPSRFVVAGDKFVDLNAAPSGLSVLNNSDGYDGQFYYRLALTPFTSKQTDFGVAFDYPAYRQQRIVYPLLARLFSLGQPSLVPISLLLVNGLALCLIGWLGSKYAQMAHHHAIWGLSFALYPGLLLALSRDLTEIVEIGFLLGVIVCVQQDRRFLAILLLVLAVLTRETALLVAVGSLIAFIFARRNDRDSFFFFLALGAISVYALWQVWLALNWIGSPVPATNIVRNFGLPFAGLSLVFRRIQFPASHVDLVWLIELLLIMAFTLAVVRVTSRSRSQAFVKASWLLFLGVMILFSGAIWVQDWAFLRVLSEFYVLGGVIIIDSDFQHKKWFLIGGIASWLVMAAHIVLVR